MSEAENRALFERYFDQVANKDNLDLADEIFATDYQHHDPANPDPRPMIGSQAVKDHLTSLKSAFPTSSSTSTTSSPRATRSSFAGPPAARTPATTSGCRRPASRSRSPG